MKPETSKLHAIIRIYKTPTAVWVIVNWCNSSVYQLATYLTWLLKESIHLPAHTTRKTYTCYYSPTEFTRRKRYKFVFIWHNYYRMCRWKVTKIKEPYLRKHLLYTFMGYTITKGNYQFFWVYNFLNKSVNTTTHATGGNNKQGSNYRLQKKQNNGLTNIKSKLLQQTLGKRYSLKQADDAPCEVKEFYEIMEILIDFIILYGLWHV
jgi:hypothetical protein